MGDGETLEAAASSSFVQHASTIAEAKVLVESQLEAEDWWGTPDDWELSFGHDSIYSDPVAVARDVARVSAVEAARGGKAVDAALPLLVELDSPSTFPMQEWRPRALAERYSWLRLRLNGCTDEGEAVTVPCGVFLQYLREQDSYRRRETAERLDIFTLCVFDSRTLDPRHATTRLADHYRSPDVPSMGLVGGGAGGRLLERLEPALRPDTRWLLLGPARSGTAIHRDPRNTAAWNTVCSGVKRWAMLSPEVSASLAERESPPEGTKWTIPDWFREEWPSIANEAIGKGGVALDFLQREGETVVVPKGWWHAVMNVRSSVAITENFVAAATLQSAIDGAATVKYPTSRMQDPAEAKRESIREAVVDCLGLVDEDAQGEIGGVWRWIRGMHDDGLLCLPRETLEQASA